MSQFCEGDKSVICSLSVEELKEYFPGLLQVSTAGQYNDNRRKRGVLVLDKGTFRAVHMRGQCPNLNDGECKLAESCFARDLEDI